MSKGKEILDHYDEYETTLSLFDPLPTEACWGENKVHPNLRSAAKHIIANALQNTPYLVIVHIPGKDITLTEEQIKWVMQEVASEE